MKGNYTSSYQHPSLVPIEFPSENNAETEIKPMYENRRDLEMDDLCIEFVDF